MSPFVAMFAVVVSVALGGGMATNGNSGGDTLGDLGDTSATVLPIDYVLALMALFGLMVADRTVGVVLELSPIARLCKFRWVRKRVGLGLGLMVADQAVRALLLLSLF